MVFVTCGAAALSGSNEKRVPQLGASLAGGLIVTVMIYTVGHISGAHMNPAVTLAFAAVRHFPWKQVPLYAAGQVIGAILGAFTLREVLDPIQDIGTTTPHGTHVQALIIEIVVTFIMMFVTSAVATDTKAVGELAGIAVGSSVCIASMFAGPISGGSMNPARTLGPAIASGQYKGIWVYIVGPVIGTLLGSGAYRIIREGTRSELELPLMQGLDQGTRATVRAIKGWGPAWVCVRVWVKGGAWTRRLGPFNVEVWPSSISGLSPGSRAGFGSGSRSKLGFRPFRGRGPASFSSGLGHARVKAELGPRSGSGIQSPQNLTPPSPLWVLKEHYQKSGVHRKVLAEVIATYLLVFVTCGAAAINGSNPQKVSQLGASVAGGLIVTVMIYTVGHISGAHMNPAVTVAFAAVHRQFPLKEVPLYAIAQFTGAIAASFTLREVLHPIKLLGTTSPSGSDGQSLAMEIVVTFIMMFVTSAVATDTKAVGELAGLAVGSSVCITSIFAGSAINNSSHHIF
uniref:Uncharacterized protein n=2 Tax=Cannabis sativa TaxID=3483 RepID=A0A803QMG1_CANSA